MPSSTLDHKQRATAAAKCALVGATFAVTEDDYGEPLFVVTKGAATCLFHSLLQVEEWVAELAELDAWHHDGMIEAAEIGSMETLFAGKSISGQASKYFRSAES